MDTTANRQDFFVWGVDQAVYGPVDLSTLVAWIKDERVLADTWIHVGKDGTWRKAGAVAELNAYFAPKPRAARLNSDADFNPVVLRRVKALACFDDDQLSSFLQFMELEQFTKGSVVCKQGDRSDTMYVILEGELRVCSKAGGREAILATLGPGDYFGDIALFDQSPRPADVVASVESTVLKLTATGLEKLARQSPELATPFLLSTIRSLVTRIRADNKRLREAVDLSSAAGR